MRTVICAIALILGVTNCGKQKPPTIVLNGAATTVAGTTFSLTVSVVDASGKPDPSFNGTIQFSSSDHAAVLPAGFVYAASSAGAAAGFSLRTVGAQTVTATSGTAATSGTVSISVTPAPAKSMQLQAPADATAGASFMFTVTIDNTLGVPDSDYTGMVHFASTDAAAQLPSAYAFTAQDGGKHTFSATLVTAGSMQLSASDNSGLSASQSITVAAGSVASFEVAAPASTTAGSALTVTATPLDAHGNVVTAYAGTPVLTATDPMATIPAGVADSQQSGTIDFAGVELVTAEAVTLTVTDEASTASGSADVSVAPGPAASFVLLMLPLRTVAGTSLSVTVVALDAWDNIATAYAGTPVLGTTDPTAVLPATHMFSSADQGQFQYTGLVFETAGSQTLTVSNGSVVGSASVEVQAGAATELTVTLDAPAAACIADGVRVAALDAYANRALGYEGTVSFFANDVGATVPSSYTFTAVDQGQHDFAGGIVPKAIGMTTLAVADAANALSASDTFTVIAGPATSLVVSGVPATVAAGEVFTATVGAQDMCGNPVASYQGTVALTSSDPAEPHLGTQTVVGSYEFTGLVLETPGTQTIDASNGNISGSATTTVSPPGIIWVETAGCASCYVFPEQMVVLADDSIVTAGVLAGSGGSSPLDEPVFGSGLANETTLVPPSEVGEILLAKYGSDGTFAWAKRAGGTNEDEPNDIRVLSSGTLLVAGGVTTTIHGGTPTDVVFGQGEANETDIASTAGAVLFLAQFSPADGTLVSVMTEGGSTSTDYAGGEGIALYPDDSFTVCAVLEGQATFGQGTPNATTLDATAVEVGMALAHFDADGGFVSATQYEGMTSTDFLSPYRCRETSDGGVIVAGSLQGTAVIGSQTLTSPGQGDVAFLGQFDTAGAPKWVDTIAVTSNTTDNSYADIQGLALDAEGDAYVAGAFSAGTVSGATASFGATTVTSGAFYSTGFVASYGADGTLNWVKLVNPASSMSDSVELTELTLASGTLVVLGRYGRGAIFGPGETGETTLTTSDSSDQEDVALAGFDPATGDLLWAHNTVVGAGSSFFQATSFSLAPRSDGAVILGGAFFGTGTFGPDDPTPVQLMGVGDDEMYLGAWWPY